MNEQQPYHSPDPFDRIMGMLAERADVTHTKPSPIQSVMPIIGQTVTVTVRTFREAEKGDWISIIYAGAQYIRIVLPPEVSERIARQREALTAMNRRKGARQGVETRKRKGIVPAFLKGKKARAKS